MLQLLLRSLIDIPRKEARKHLEKRSQIPLHVVQVIEREFSALPFERFVNACPRCCGIADSSIPLLTQLSKQKAVNCRFKTADALRKYVEQPCSPASYRGDLRRNISHVALYSLSPSPENCRPYGRHDRHAAGTAPFLAARCKE